jgi:O-antigen/teichoic acid export membrane protein
MSIARSVTRNTFWNVVGQVLPVAAAILAVPLLISRLGQDRFGVLTMVWVVVGYSGLFDFGVGRALTTLVAGALGAGRAREIPALVWTSLILMFGLGVVGGGVIALGSPWFVHRLMRIPAALSPEMIQALWVLAAAIPVIIACAGLVGILEACQRFDLITAVRAPLGIASYVGPLVIALFYPNLVGIAIFLAASRTVAAIAYFWLCWRTVPEMRAKPLFTKSVVPRVFQLGGWMTVTNLISPLMASMDRFFVGALISTSAVGYYATSQEVVGRSTVMPVALAGALFPSFAGASANNKRLNVELFGRALDYMFLVTFPLALAMIGLAPEGMALWLGKGFAQAATLALQILACGMFVNSLARVPFTFLQAASRPDLAAKAHLVELPLYVGMVCGLALLFGINGVALAWSLRVLVDAVILLFLSYRLSPDLWPAIRRLGKLTVPAYAAFGILMVPSSPLFRYGMLTGMLGLFCYLSWTVLLTSDEQQSVRRLAGAWRRSAVACVGTTES